MDPTGRAQKDWSAIALSVTQRERCFADGPNLGRPTVHERTHSLDLDDMLCDLSKRCEDVADK